MLCRRWHRYFSWCWEIDCTCWSLGYVSDFRTRIRVKQIWVLKQQIISGSGKSTVIQLLEQLYDPHPTSGDMVGFEIRIIGSRVSWHHFRRLIIPKSVTTISNTWEETCPWLGKNLSYFRAQSWKMLNLVFPEPLKNKLKMLVKSQMLKVSSKDFPR